MCSSRPDAQISWGDAPFCQYSRRFGHHHRRSAHCAAAQVHQMPIVRESVDARVLAHRRHADAIPKCHFTNLERSEQMSRAGG